MILACACTLLVVSAALFATGQKQPPAAVVELHRKVWKP
jgi:selenocysteine lyase/cysteine desulfurase